MWVFLYEKYETFTLIMNDITKRSIGAGHMQTQCFAFSHSGRKPVKLNRMVTLIEPADAKIRFYLIQRLPLFKFYLKNISPPALLTMSPSKRLTCVSQAKC